MTPFEYLLASLELFQSYRADTSRRLQDLGARLELEASLPPSVRGRGVTGDAMARLAGLVRAVFESAKLLSVYRRQAEWMRATSSESLLLALASNRLGSPLIASGAREFLSDLTTPLGPQPTDGLSNRVRRADAILILDPLPISGLWTYAESLRNERVAVVDCGFLAYLSIWSLPSIAYRFCQMLLDPGARRRLFQSKYALRDGVAAYLLSEGYRSLLSGQRMVDAYFLTSNSFATEVLRSQLLISPVCISVCEIQHGVPPLWEEPYFAALIGLASSNGAPSKHSFIPQVQLPSVGVFQYPDEPRAINSYFNKNVAERLRGKAFDRTISEACQLITQDSSTTSDALVVLVTGTTSWLDDNTVVGAESGSFALEQRLMTQAQATMSAAGRRAVIVYVPHPAVPLLQVQSHPFFRDSRFLVYDSTVVMWLLADICLSLYSSTLHESRAFGLACYTPIREDDRVYPSALLELLEHPMRNETFETGLVRFLESHSKPLVPRDLDKRARQRMAMARPVQSDRIELATA